MKRLIILVVAAILIAVGVARADVCVDPNTPDDPSDDICVPESPVNPAGTERLFLPIVAR